MMDIPINTTELGDEVINKVMPLVLDKLSPLITLFKVVGIAILVYILFLIIKTLFKLRTSFKISKIAKNVEQINKKLDILIKNQKFQKENIKKKKGKK